MKSFNHVNANTINGAVKSLKSYRGKAKLIAGGTDLLSILKDKVLPDYPEALIDIKTVRGIDYIKEDSRGLRIGALTRLADIAEHPTVRQNYKILAEAAEAVATPQIRNMATIGGNLCQDVRCWYYRYPHRVGGRILCHRKGINGCHALFGENQYHSIFGGCRVSPPPCSCACPGDVEIPSYLSKIREGDLTGAARILLNTNPMPSITGRVCPHFCEQVCNRGDFDESVSVRDIERFIGDYILENAEEIIKAPENNTGKSIAVIGSGPAGLSAAYYLRMAGHRVTVFERMDKAGGMLAYVIPAYRLPKDIVRNVVKTLENIGVEFRLKVDIGKDESLDNLKKKFDSIFIATGAWAPVSIGLDGEESTKFGVEFLTNINLGVKEIPGKKVLVIGGGNAAIDVAISSLRLGAEEATLACLESLEEMPALLWEIEQAVEEGVKLMTSWGPEKVLKSGVEVTGMELVRCTSVFDKQGCFAPALDKSVKETVEADSIMMAVGYATELNFIDSRSPLKVEKGLIPVDSETQITTIPGVFAGGSAAHGPATVIEAIASGRKAAAAMDAYLKETAVKTKHKDEKYGQNLLRFNNDKLKTTDRVKMPKLPVTTRRIDTEDALGLGLSEMEGESNRCFNCGCLAVNSSDMAVALVALDAKVKIAGPGGIKTVLAGEFFSSLPNILETDEMVTEIHVPLPASTAKQQFTKFRLREAIDFPLVSIASLVTLKDGICKDARIVLGAVAPTPMRVLEAEKFIKGKAINESTVEAVTDTAVLGVIPLKKNVHKVEITKTLVKRALLSSE